MRWATSFLAVAGILVLSAAAQTLPLQGALSPLATFPGLQVAGITADASGAVIVAGETTSSGYPTTPNAARQTHTSALCPVIGPFPPAPCGDGYVARVSRDGTLLYGSYFDISGAAPHLNVAVDAAGAIFVAGSNFLTKFAPDGSLAFSRSLPQGIYPSRLLLSPTGEILLGGECSPTSVAWTSTFLAGPGGPGADGACYLRLAGNGTDVLAATILRGSMAAFATDMTVDSAGNVYLAGVSGSLDFPLHANSWIAASSASYYGPVFAVELSPDGTQLLASALFGGEEAQLDPIIRVADSGEVVLAGNTGSYQFPVTPGAFGTAKLGNAFDENIYVVKLAPGMGAPVFSTYISGEQEDHVSGFWIGGDGAVTLAGYTNSSLFPTTPDALERCLQVDWYSNDQAFVARLAADGSALIYSSYVNQGPGGAFTAGVTWNGALVLDLAYGAIMVLNPVAEPASPRFCVVNAANFLATGVTSREIVSVLGRGLAGATVTVGGQPAQVLYSSDGQLNAILPDGLPSGATVHIEVDNGGAVVGSADPPVANDTPGLFRYFQTSEIVADHDVDGSPVTTTNPAVPGEVVRVYGTGFGNVRPLEFRLGPLVAPALSFNESNGVMEFRLTVPNATVDLALDFMLPGSGFAVPGLVLPAAH
jgi:uncharacterized protein (TIGR03437 family)